MKRLAVLAFAAVAVLGACGQEAATKSGGTVQPASSSESTAPTATTAAPSSTVTTAKVSTTTAKPTTTTARATTTTTEQVTATTAASSVSYANCSAVKAAGAAPLHRGDPGYATKLDRDGDGVACES